MVRLFHKASRKVGLMPGSVVYVGKERTEDVRIEVIDYSETELHQQHVTDPEACTPFRDSRNISWINVDGIHDVETVERLGVQFGLHPLVLEDVVNVGQRPKVEEFSDYLFVTLKMLYLNEEQKLMGEHVSVLMGEWWVITFQETGTDVFDHVRKRIKTTVPRVRFMSTDYLAYALLDAVIDNYFVVLEHIGERIEELEDEISGSPDMDALLTIRDLKKELVYVRKAVWPLREVIGGLERMETRLIKSELSPYLRDLYEHAVQVIDTVETFRDMVSGLLDLYHTGVSNRMNEVMKVLTIFATIFIPLGFLAGVYGMNFDAAASPFNMPELGFRFGYPMFWVLAVGLAAGLLVFFRKKKWL